MQIDATMSTKYRPAKLMTMCYGPKWKKKHRKNSHQIIHCPTSERLSKVSEQASGPVLQSIFLVFLNHSATATTTLTTMAFIAVAVMTAATLAIKNAKDEGVT